MRWVRLWSSPPHCAFRGRRARAHNPLMSRWTTPQPDTGDGAFDVNSDFQEARRGLTYGIRELGQGWMLHAVLSRLNPSIDVVRMTFLEITI